MTDEERREYRKKWLKDRYENDPVWRQKQIDRVSASLKDRYKNDPEFRAKKIAYAKERVVS